MWTSSAILFISLFCISKLILLFSYSFHVQCIILCNVYFYIAHSMFPFLFNWSQWKASVVDQMSRLFLQAQKYFFCSFQLFENHHTHNVFRRWSTLWNSTLKITTLFRRFLTLLMSTLKIINIDLILSDVATLRH